MKLTIDTQNKTIELKDSKVSLSELVRELDKLFPNNSYMEYELVVREVKLSSLGLFPQTQPNNPFLPYIKSSPLDNPPNIYCSYNATATNK